MIQPADMSRGIIPAEIEQQSALSPEDPRRYLLTSEHIQAALDLLFSPEWGREQQPQGAADDGAAILAGEQNENGAVSDDIGP